MLKRSVASFAVVFAFAVFFAPQTALALDETPSQPEVPTTVLPTTCTALLGITPTPEPPTPQTPPGQTETPTIPTPPPTTPTPSTPTISTWSPLALSTLQSTNNAALSWSWTAPVSTDPAAAFSGYGFALYNGDVLVANGELGAEVLQYAYAAPADGQYRLFVWILDTTENPTTPVATGCEYRDTILDTTAPAVVINGEGFTSNGNTATPSLTTTEADLTYNWAVDADNSFVTISNTAELTPIFTFLKDGLFTFTLTVTDSLGNVATVTLEISYAAPYIPTPEAPLPPVVIAPVDPYVPPAVVLAETKRAVAIGASYEAAVSTDVMSDDTQIPANSAATSKNDPSAVAAATTSQAVQRSSQGWLILGVPWYWWLLGLAIIITAIQWYRSGAFRKTPDDI